MLFAGWEVRIVKNCDRGLENAARGRRPRATLSSPRSQLFTIRTDPKPVNNLFIFFQASQTTFFHSRRTTRLANAVDYDNSVFFLNIYFNNASSFLVL